MRWYVYFILAYIVLGAQVAVGGFVSVRGAAPNLALLGVIFIVLHAPRDAALLGCFAMGLLQDLLSTHPVGLLAFAYGFVGLLVRAVHQMMHRDHPLTHVAMSLLGGLTVMAIVLIHGWWRPVLPHTALGEAPALATPMAALRPSVATEFMRVVLTVLLSPLVIGLLQWAKKLFGFRQEYRRANLRSSH